MYEEFSKIYDILMEDSDYNAWTEYIIQLFEKHDVKPKNILDLACGTGNITIPLSKSGYNMCGVDISESMLAIAENKARSNKCKIKFIQQDIRELNLSEKFDAVTCACDGINYILKEEELISVLLRIYDALSENGILIFDISSYFKLRFILGNNTLFEEKNDICYCWENEFDLSSSIVKMRLNFFVPKGHLYHRFEEIHYQKAYKNSFIINSLKSCGFSKASCYECFSLDEPKKTNERVIFVATK
ncbi:MAG: class I SAM-dependent methyltransferase [Firmicutes bacterium]|nr:class I SAM-dependent methyltransferase [Bacillota bacterium]